MNTETIDDARLVELARNGQRDAFGRIVERYQSLVCALTYSACGNVQASEDLAQVTFITAWCELPKLKEPAKLQSWLCGIARNVTNNSFRQNKRTPTANAEELDPTATADAPTPRDHVILKEEEAILWRSLSELPDTYREPLVLFYRQHQSVAEVADALELSEDAVKQRLSRGRTMLTEKVAAFIEGALTRTNPGKAFTIGVLAALPVLATSAQAAAVGVAAAKGSATAKAAAILGLSGAILGSIIGLAAGWLGTKVSIENTESPRERQFMVKSARIMWTLVILFCLVTFLFAVLGGRWWQAHPIAATITFMGVTLVYVGAVLALVRWTNRNQRSIRNEEAAKRTPGTPAPAKAVVFEPVEYRSRWMLFGLPLVHIQMENKNDGKTQPAKGWIAVGNIAYGLLFAAGGVAIAPVSMGGCAIGLVAVGGCAVGLLAFAGLAIGVWAVGGVAAGYLAAGGSAFAWRAAMGGTAVAHDIAAGGVAYGHHANDAVARAFMQNNSFFTNSMSAMEHASWLMFLPMLLVVWQLMRARRMRSGSR